MKTEFRRAVLPKEVRGLMAFDRRVFRPADRFPARFYWKQLEAYWLIADGVKGGVLRVRDQRRV